MVSLRLKTAVRLIRLWQRWGRSIVLGAGLVTICLPWVWITVALHNDGGVFIHVVDSPSDKKLAKGAWPHTLLRAHFGPTFITITSPYGCWNCPASTGEWMQAIK